MFSCRRLNPLASPPIAAAMKYGKFFHIRMTNSAVAFKEKFNSSDCFPLQVLAAVRWGGGGVPREPVV